MKRIISMLAIFLLTIGIVSANGYDSETFMVDMNLEVTDGYAFQMINIDDYKTNVVAIGNFDVVAECVPPWNLPDSIFEAAVEGLDYDYWTHGSGTIDTTFIVADYGIHQFQQTAIGHTIAIAQMTDICENTQELLIATDGYMNWNEQMMVDINTINGDVQSVFVSQEATMDAWGYYGQSMLYNSIDIPDLAFDAYQYAAAPDIDWSFGLVYPLE